MDLPSRPGPQSDLVRPLARPSSLSRRFTDSDPTRAYTGVYATAGDCAGDVRYLPSNPDTWTTISGSGTDICRMHAGNTHGKPRAARCDFCPMHPCRVPHTPRCRTDRWFWHVGAAAAIFIEFVWQIATNGCAQSIRTPSRPRAPLGPPVELVSPFHGFGSHVRIRWYIYATLVTAPALRYLPSNPDIWTTISGSGTDIFRMRACNTHSKPRATRCNFCPMRLCRVPHTARCRAD